jgi:hypothetical protein
MMPFAMHSFNSMMICGKRAGQPFVNATRPDSETRLCPNNTLACSNFTAPDNTVCYPSDQKRDEVCPITGFEFSSSDGTLPTLRNPVT